MRPLGCAATLVVLALTACRSPASPRGERDLAQQEIARGDVAGGARRMEAALLAADERDPAEWNRLGEVASSVDRALADRAFDRAETLLWPGGSADAVVLALPFAGRWRVTQGNRGEFSHRRLADRFAWDFQEVDERGEPCRGAGGDPSAFYAFGAPIVAPADGVVERAEDGVPDNADGARNHERPAGNVVVLRHASGRMSHFCHLQCGSVAVSPRQFVRRGETIARCGCSGNAIEPHLHYVLRMGSTSRDFSVPVTFEGAAGVPAQDEIVGTR